MAFPVLAMGEAAAALVTLGAAAATGSGVTAFPAVAGAAFLASEADEVSVLVSAGSFLGSSFDSA